VSRVESADHLAPPGRITSFIAGRRTKWIVLAAWIVALVALGPLAGKLGDVEKNDAEAWLPASAESTEATELLSRFAGSDLVPAVLVYQRESGLTPADHAAVAQTRTDVSGMAAGDMPPLIPSEDGKAILLTVPLSEDGALDKVKELQQVADRAPPGLEAKVSGPAGGMEAFVSSFEGTDTTLFAAAAIVVAILLLLIYRSPVLWILPLLSAATATVTAMSVVYLLADNAGLTVNGQTAGILPVLVFGAGTDYALLLLARYREELHIHEDRHRAMAVALRRSGPAIIASSATVALGMLCLLVADLSSNAGLGPVAAVGVVCALLAITTLLPALMVVFGRWIFWPKRPHPHTEVDETRTVWGAVGRRAARRPRLVWVGTAGALAAFGIAAFTVDTGLGFADQFRGTPDAVVGQQMMERHFPSGQTAPAEIVAKASSADAVATAARSTEGIGAVLPPVRSTDGQLVKVSAVLTETDPEKAGPIVERLRAAVHAVPGADARVGGEPAAAYDIAEASSHDRTWVPPLVLGVIVLVLILLLRSLVAPLLLVATVVLSFGAAVGASWLLFSGPFGFAGVDDSWMLLGFVLLVALGVDYNIFLAHRTREEVAKHGHREGVINGLAVTGGVITSAGLVLAATFLALAVLPLVSMTEMGILIALGVLLDTFVVRPLLVPMLAIDLGEKFWWPGRPAARRRQPLPADRPADEADDLEPAGV
jgi:RND superfamily putative drug exporter